MSRKALFVGLEYQYEPQSCSSVNDVLELNKCLVERLHFLQSDINILVDISATGRGKSQFHPNDVPRKFNLLISAAQEGDILLFAFSGSGTFRGPKICLRHDEKDEEVFMTAGDFEIALQIIPRGVRLYILIDCHGCSGLFDGFNFARFPSVVALTSCMRGMLSKQFFSYRWECWCSHFIYVVVRALETNQGISNVRLFQWTSLLLEETDVLFDVQRRLRAQNLEKEEKKDALRRATVLQSIQRPVLFCSYAKMKDQFLS